MNNDYYRLLNVTPAATQEEIQKSYRALARRFHPDLNRSSAASTLMAALNEAYGILGEPAKRAVYDRTKHKDKNPAVTDAILSAARDALIRQGWMVVEDHPNDFVLTKGSRTVHVGLMRSANSWNVRQLLRRAAGFLVVLTVNADTGMKIPTESLAVIDLMRSLVVYGSFPDSVYQDLFGRFVKAA